MPFLRGVGAGDRPSAAEAVLPASKNKAGQPEAMGPNLSPREDRSEG